MKRVIIYLMAVALTLYTAVLYGSDSFLMLFFAELILPVILLVCLIPLGWNLRVNLQLPIPVTEQGQSVPVVMRLTNQSIIPCSRIAVQVTCRLPMGEGKQKTWFYGNVPGRRGSSPARGTLRAQYDANGIGGTQMEITRVRCYDLIGLFAIPLRRKYWQQMEPEKLLVVPAVSQVPVFVSRQSRDFAGESEEYSRERGGDDPSETFQIREYQPGDKMRSVHWKLSVKTDELMVCERSLPLGCPVLFYLDLSQSSRSSMPFRGRGQSQKMDSFLQTVASLSYGMVQEGCRHYIIWFDAKRKDIRRFRVEKEEDVYEMLLQLGGIPGYTRQENLEELYWQKYHENQYITRLEINRQLELYQNGELLVKYDSRPEKLEKQLGEQELIV